MNKRENYVLNEKVVADDYGAYYASQDRDWSS